MSVVKVKTWEKAETEKDSSFIKKLGKFLSILLLCAGLGGIAAAMIKMFWWGFKNIWSMLKFL